MIEVVVFSWCLAVFVITYILIQKRIAKREANPSKQLVLKNLNQILQLLKEDSRYIAAERIKWLISDIEKNKLTKNIHHD